MFLAIREIRHSKLRYGLITGMIVLIAYLIFVLTALAYGLAESNREAIDSWNAENIVLNEDADGALRQSTLTQEQIDDMETTGKSAKLGQLSAVIDSEDAASADTSNDSAGDSTADDTKTSAEILGIDPDEFIYEQLEVDSGDKFDTDSSSSTSSDNVVMQAVADDSLRNDGYELGDTLTVGSGDDEITIVGFTTNAKLSVAPVLYVPLDTWHELKFGADTSVGSAGGSTSGAPAGTSAASPGTDIAASAVVIQDGSLTNTVDGVEQLSIDEFIEKLPGYSAQNATFSLMIGFLLVISLVIIAIFLYILTMQKIPNLTVMKVQGITSGYLIRNTVVQALLITVAGVVIGAVLTALTALFIPPSVPMSFNIPLLAGVGLLLVVMAGLGSLAPIRTIVKIKPTALVSGD